MGFNKIKKIIIKITPVRIQNIFQESVKKENMKLDSYATLSYSQEGEDLILKRIFEGQKEGFYLDVGAHHPKRFSNTYEFYKMGWRGINIDAMPGSMDGFRKVRPDDINLEYAISNSKENLDFYVFNEPALNTFSRIEAEKNDGVKGYKIVERIKLKTYLLSEILNQYLKEDDKIDFLTIDVEGLDFQVLKSNNWNKFKPFIILVEILNMNSIGDIEKSDINIFLVSKGYSLYAKTTNTCFYKILI
ncbi:FkbM family methyltransferase [Gillisia limnaea]|uniref:SAM-dependent methyltransferase n=1 Tax=Gillisia limnaea (strain DSM 15749 / LMG 21470 / R-8282) TaxID=865937 RepID=H2BV93_GILLR|nr:FkbM family methyltransferase [Gillisia limnaea]EHQ01758.1 SAM-dependent methyltransferase [Gillisia limnaea DSM 15749]